MADRFTAEIEVGGNLSPLLVADFISAANKSYALMEWGEWNEVDPAFIERAAFNKEPVRFVNEEAAWGEFLELEEWCREHNLTYVRQSESGYEYPGETAWWEPGMLNPDMLPSESDGEVYINIRELKRWKEQGRNLDDVITHLSRVPTVPPIAITEG